MMYHTVQKAALRVIVCLCCVYIFGACTKNISKNLDREHLFSIEYGGFEEQIDLFDLQSEYTRPDSQIYMDEGMFYISNTRSGKILQCTSFGDLLALYYNANKNPAPSITDRNAFVSHRTLLQESLESIVGNQTGYGVSIENPVEKAAFALPEVPFMKPAAESLPASATTTRRIVEYPFNRPSFLTVTRRKHLYTVDSVPEDRIQYDYTENLALRDVVVHFNDEGELVNVIGQEGSGGTPFPLIEGLYTAYDESLIVVARTQTQIKVYWFDVEGRLRYNIPLAFDRLPSPYNTTEKVFSSVDKVVPDFNAEKIYLKIDYYREEIDSTSQVSAGITYDKSRLYVFNLTNKQYERGVDIAPYETSEKTSAGVSRFKKVYNLLGISLQEWCFLTIPVEGGYMLEVIDLPSNKIYRRFLAVHDDELLYHALSLSPNGILSALLAGSDKAHIVWWRTNELIGATYE